MQNQASLTALMSAFGRAFHAENEFAPIFNDSLAGALMTREEYGAMGHYILSGLDFFAPERKGSFADEAQALRYLVHTQIAPTPLARARFCEDSLKAAVHAGAEQYVILGAGLDSFAWREAEILKRCRVFEVDHPATQADKRARVARAGWGIPENLRFVPLDFSSGDLREELLKAGFNPQKRSFFSWLGVSYYLSTAEIEAMLAALATLCAPGSCLVFDYADEGLFESKIRRVQNMLAMAQAGGEAMKSCFDAAALERLLNQHGFAISEHLPPDAIQARYFSGRGAELTAFEHIHYVSAICNPEKRNEAENA